MDYIQIAIRTSIFPILIIGLCCSNALAGTFTVSGTFIPDEVPTPEDEELTNEVAHHSSMSEAHVSVLHRENAKSADTGEKVIAQGTMSNGSILLTGEINETMAATISVDAGLEVPLTLNTVLAPGRDVSFALLEQPTVLAFLGTINSVRNTAQQFRIYGNISSVQADLELATVSVRFVERDEFGDLVNTTWHVLMKDDRFEIVGEVTEPRVVNILAYKGVNFSQTHAVIEPGVELEVKTRTPSLDDLYALSPSGNGRHALLIDSWQQNPEYWATKRWYTQAVIDHQQELIDRQQPSIGIPIQQPDSEGINSPEVTIEQEVAEKDTKNDNDECSKYVTRPQRETTQRTAIDTEDIPEHVKIFREFNRLRLDTLEKIAENTAEPINSLIALELGAYLGEPKRQDIYNRLDEVLDADIVRRRVTHDRNDHARFLNEQERIYSLSVGTKAPAFALRDLEGRTVELYDIVHNHENVLVEFWASWCGPCIQTLPDLREIYAQRSAEGFEIVSVSLDRTHSDWAEATEEHELPWINLAELQDSSSEVAQVYGVSYIPKNYLLDNNGCIVKKDLSSAQLKRTLASAFDRASTSEAD